MSRKYVVIPKIENCVWSAPSDDEQDYQASASDRTMVVISQDRSTPINTGLLNADGSNIFRVDWSPLGFIEFGP